MPSSRPSPKRILSLASTTAFSPMAVAVVKSPALTSARNPIPVSLDPVVVTRMGGGHGVLGTAP